MTAGIRSDASGTFGALTFGGGDAVTFDATGIKAGSYKAGSIVAADFADGALIENAPVGIGYGTGAGGTVTQATSKTTAVTLNKPSGKIIMHPASLASNVWVNFVCNNSLISSSEVIVPTIQSDSVTSFRYTVNALVRPGQIIFGVKQESGAAMADAVQINFNILKAAVN